ncbi:transcriptional regulator [Pseudonocardia sulfidoxydans NBRC 16205]|uniref:Transcriptional regulator n=1 Tax=Pseudonocardia sulfidoxydans NBRC 16205 TaxID=1223511 RepID=A0A511DGS2_9PSEU|nr:helix-turn-helix domain-containing protein [Pseudonocardia sulfidoxydans]GEL23976.1 transcriptional regulator [Pseudonocardia sulfidoxydans NBRC 16205]
MSPRHVSTRRDEILAALRAADEPLGIAELAETLALHPNTVRFHLDALLDAGRVERVTAPPAGPGRPALLFRAHRGMDPAGPRSYRLLAAALADGLAAGPGPGAAAQAAGRAWGGRLVGATEPRSRDDAIRSMVALLDDIGFAPAWPAPGGHDQRIGLRHCPFLELAETRADVVCPLHLGLMQGAMSALGAPVTVDRLDPFAADDLCLAHLSPTDPREDGR